MRGDNIYICEVSGDKSLSLAQQAGGARRRRRCEALSSSQTYHSQQTLLPPSGCLRQDEISEPEKYPAGTKRQEGRGRGYSQHLQRRRKLRNSNPDKNLQYVARLLTTAVWRPPPPPYNDDHF